MKQRIALLGWGSLLWDEDRNKDVDTHHNVWKCDGPTLMLEFSRISISRECALTLVIDPHHGSPVTVAWSISSRKTIEEVVGDLRKREGENIGMLVISGEALDVDNKSIDKESFDSIRDWAVKRELGGVVWTNLGSNFLKKKGRPFSIEAACDHLKSLESKQSAKAIEYIKRAPCFVQTQLRTAIDSQSGL